MSGRLSIAWPPGPDHPRLSGADVHLWCIWLDDPDADPVALAGLLSTDERLRAQRLRFARDRRRFVVVHARLRTILARYLGADAASLRFATGPAGKPALIQPPDGRELQFNLSHSSSLALLAVDHQAPIGVDLERIRPLDELTGIADRCFTPAEAGWLRQLSGAEQLKAFFLLWTQKEAVVKAQGDGLAGLEAATAAVAPPESSRNGSAPSWTVATLQPAAGYAAAFATSLARPALHCWQWPTAERTAGPIARAPMPASR